MLPLLFLFLMLGSAACQQVKVSANFTITCLKQPGPFHYNMTLWETGAVSSNDLVAEITGTGTEVAHGSIGGPHGDSDPGWDYEFYLRIFSDCRGQQFWILPVWVHLAPDCRKSASTCASTCAYSNVVIHLDS